MSNFDKITETPEVLAAFLAALPVANGPWDQEFHAQYCADCLYLGCDSCPHSAQRNNPLWWLMQNAAQERESKKKGESGMDEQRIYRAALEKWGADAQTLMAFEEMAELQKELCKCARGNDNWEAIAEEIADVEIMLEQMKILHDCAGVSAGYKRRKLERLVERLGGTGLTMAFRDGVKPAKLGPGMVFRNGRAHVQDGPTTANLGQGTYFRTENTPVSAPCDPQNGITVEVWDRLKNLCEFCKEMSKRGGIWAERSWGIDAAALEFAIGWIEGAQAAQEAAKDAPEAAAGTDTFRATEEAAQNAWEAVRDILAGKRPAPDGAVFNVTVDLAGSPKTIRTGTEQDAAGGVILKTHSGEEVLLKTPEEAFALAGCIQEMASRVWPWPKGGN